MKPSLRLLITEDCEDAALMLVEELSRHGYGVEYQRVETPLDYRAALNEGGWDAIIADYVVPKLGALSALKIMKESEMDIPLLVVSGTMGEEVAVEVMKAGAKDFISKSHLGRLGPALERELEEAQDRAARRKAEAALNQNDAVFRGVVESLGEGLILTDLEGVVWHGNGQILEMTGFGAEELEGKSFYRTCSAPENWAEAEEKLGAIASGATKRFEMELLRKNREKFWAAISLAPLRNPEEGIIGAVAAISDVTERRQSREALLRNEESLRLAQKVGRIGSWELNLETLSLGWSEETYRIFGCDPALFAPSRRSFLEMVHSDDREMVQAAVRKAVTGQSTYDIDHRIVLPGGEVRFVHEQGQVIHGTANQPARLTGIVQDITERKLLEEQLRHSQKMEAVGELAGGIAHDFNNILTIIQGYVELVLQEKLSDQARHDLLQVAESTERATQLTRQLLAFSRKQMLQFKLVDLSRTLHQLTASLQRLLGEHIELELRLPKQIPPIRADGGMIEQVLINLTVNSRDAMPRGGRLIIETSVHEIDHEYCRIHPDANPGQFVCLSVMDTGVGMDAETLRHIFEPFFTTKEVGKGTGLGLSTAYGIVRQHQGWIQVSSQPSAGTVFKIFFPAQPQAVVDLSPPNELLEARGGTETILVVEDEPALLELAKVVLENYGYRILEASSGPEALKLFKETEENIELLLTDMVMPGGMTGRELARHLQKLQPSLKVVYISGYSIDFVKDEFALTEGLNFIAKPYTGTRLARAVREILDQGQIGS